MAQLTVTIITHDEDFKRQAAQLLRACGVPIGILEARAGAETSPPDIALVDIRADASSGMAAIERLRASQPAMADLRDCRQRRAGPHPSGDAGRGERVLPVDARRGDAGVALDGGVVPRRGPAHGRAPRGGDRGHPTALRDARLPRRQGRRGDDDGGGELRGGAGAADEAADGDRRPEDAASARSRCSSACGRASPCSTRSRTCTASTRTSSRSWCRSTSPGSTSSPARSSSIGRTRRTSAAIEELLRVLDPDLRLRRSSTPATRSTRARSRRSTRPTRCSW